MYLNMGYPYARLDSMCFMSDVSFKPQEPPYEWVLTLSIFQLRPLRNREVNVSSLDKWVVRI